MSLPPQPRALLEDEWPALRSAINEVFRPDGGDLTDECPLLFDPTNRENLRVIVDTPAEGAPGTAGSLGHTLPPADTVAHRRRNRVLAHGGLLFRDVRVLRRRLRVACVGAVFTATKMRGRGLASRILADVLARARAAADVVLVSGDRDLYRRHGLLPIPPLARFRLTVGFPPASVVEVREAAADDLSAMAALYDAEDVHFVRSAIDWCRLWGAGRLVDAPARFWIISRAGRVVAYAAAQHTSPRQEEAGLAEKPGIAGGPREREGRILEIAGDRASLLQAAPAVAAELLLPWYDSSTIELCERKRWLRTARQFPITAAALTAGVPAIPWYGLNYV